jgi:beta-glucosidase-like glycosyl hydrolase
MSDWFGTYSANTVKGGIDLEMPRPARWMDNKVLAQVKQGNVSIEMSNDKICRLLYTIERAGAFEHPELQPERAIDKLEHPASARQAASDAIVLLKNDRVVLSLDPSRIKSIAVIGESALPLKTLVEDIRSRAVLEKYFAAQLVRMHLDTVGGMTLEKMAAHMPKASTPQVLELITENLATIERKHDGAQSETAPRLMLAAAARYEIVDGFRS